MSELEPFFLDSASGPIFVLHRSPSVARGIVIVVPPFAEEMNKTRRQNTLLADRLVAEGFAVLSMDLFGTGDSQGDFADSTWHTWCADVVNCIDWARRANYDRIGIVATRLGAILASQALARAGVESERSVFWQPVTDGAQFMNQFVRLRVVSSMMGPGGGETAESITARLENGDALDIAGYRLDPRLWNDIRELRLEDEVGKHIGKSTVIEVRRSDDGGISARTRKLVQHATSLGVLLESCSVPGDPFWSSTEIVTNPALVEATAAAFSETR